VAGCVVAAYVYRMMRLPAIFAMSCCEDGRWLVVSRQDAGATFDRREISAADSRALYVAGEMTAQIVPQSVRRVDGKREFAVTSP
jgi:hypothetical protein